MSKRTAILRLLSWPKPKQKRFWGRYYQWMSYRLTKYGTGKQISREQELANRKMQIQISYFNEQARRENDYN